MAKILFINPTVRNHDKPRHIPYGMSILVQQVIDAGHQVQVYDENAWRPEKPEELLAEVLRADDWDIIATGGLTTTYNALRHILILSRRLRPDALIVAGGGFFTSMPRDIMNFRKEIDVGVVGEAYATFPEICSLKDEALRSGTAPDWGKCRGIAFRKADGEIVFTPSRALLHREELDRLPYPAIEMFPMEKYWENSGVFLSEVAMTSRRRLDVNASYGCTLICRFCWHLGLVGDTRIAKTSRGDDAAFTYERDIRWHSPEYVVKMVRHWRDKYEIDSLAFLDENLMTMHRATKGTWLPEICRLWKEYDLQPECVKKGIPHDPETCRGVHWGGTSHSTQLDPAVLPLMFQAGCTYLDYGLESFNTRILKNLGKAATPEMNKKAVRITMDAGIRPIPNQIIGFPDEFFDSIEDSMRAWEEMGIVVFPFLATPYPGSEWFTVYRDKILRQYDGDLEAFILDLEDATKISANICESFSTVELLGLRELMVNFNYRKIHEFEKEFWARNKTARIPKFLARGWRERVKELECGAREDIFQRDYVEVSSTEELKKTSF